MGTHTHTHTFSLGLHTPRENRLCQRCSARCVEDEMHVFECAKYEALRQKHGITLPPACDDAYFCSLMNPANGADWKRLAAYLSDVFLMRNA